MEYHRGFSLCEIIEYTGCINENLLSKIINQMLNCFDEYRNQFDKEYENICFCELYFDRNGYLKVLYSYIALAKFFK